MVMLSKIVVVAREWRNIKISLVRKLCRLMISPIMLAPEETQKVRTTAEFL